jgi:hypothetical protein
MFLRVSTSLFLDAPVAPHPTSELPSRHTLLPRLDRRRPALDAGPDVAVTGVGGREIDYSSCASIPVGRRWMRRRMLIPKNLSCFLPSPCISSGLLSL